MNLEVLDQKTLRVCNNSFNIRFVEQDKLYKLFFFIDGDFHKEIFLRQHTDEQSKEQSKREYQLVCEAFR